MRELRSRVMRVNATVIFPLLALFVAVAPEVVPWLFGEQWEPAVVPAQILTIAGMARMINNGTPAVMLAAGKPRVLLYFNLYRAHRARPDGPVRVAVGPAAPSASPSRSSR